MFPHAVANQLKKGRRGFGHEFHSVTILYSDVIIKKMKNLLAFFFDFIHLFFVIVVYFFFGDKFFIFFPKKVVQFTTYASQASPQEVVQLLTELFSRFDRVVEKYKVYKLQT